MKTIRGMGFKFLLLAILAICDDYARLKVATRWRRQHYVSLTKTSLRLRSAFPALWRPLPPTGGIIVGHAC